MSIEAQETKQFFNSKLDCFTAWQILCSLRELEIDRMGGAERPQLRREG